MKYRGVAIVLVVAFTLFTACRGREISIFTYNLHNLFDAKADGGEYKAYLPESGWTEKDFDQKLKNLSEVILNYNCNRSQGPDILAFQEVENRFALEQLKTRYLANYGYDSLVFVPQPGLNVNCAILSRLPIKRTAYYSPGRWNGQPLRGILEAEFAGEGASLFLFVVHFKSRSGGEAASEPARIMATRVLADRLREILGEAPAADIVVLGDFNENINEFWEQGYQTALISEEYQGQTLSPRQINDYKSDSLFLTTTAGQASLVEGRVRLYDSWYAMAEENRSSYVYKGQWYTLDHILLSSGLADRQGFSLVTASFYVARCDFLLTPRSRQPLRDKNYRYVYSDHLGLSIKIKSP